MSGSETNQSNQLDLVTPTGERTESALVAFIASPIPPFLYGNTSGSSTPESEVESSLAYKGTERYSCKSRQERKLKKKREKLKSVEKGDSSDQSKDEKEKSASIKVEVTEVNSKYTQTDVSYKGEKKKNLDKEKDKVRCLSKYVQTDMDVLQLDNMLNTDIYDFGLDEMKNLFSKLKQVLCTLPDCHSNGEVFDGSQSDDSMYDAHAASEDRTTNSTSEEMEIPDLGKNTKEKKERTKKVSIRIDEPHRDSSHCTDLKSLGMSDEREKKKEKKKKLSTQSDDPPFYRTSLDVKETRRVNSAHSMGRNSMPDGGTIIDIFKAHGATVKKDEPQILKYVGERPDMKHDYDSTNIAGWLEGLCQFCGNQLHEIPTVEQVNDPLLSSKIKYCCTEFKYFIGLQIMNEEFEVPVVDELIDIAPSAPFGAKNNQKTARERLADRQRERELERQKAAAQQANLFSFARQMKTIQYSLASKKCMSEGWTVKPVTPPPPEPKVKENQFHIEVNSTLLQSSGVWVNKTYENGKPFLHIFPDGTGCLYYPSGHVAVLITAVEKRKFTYIVQTNKSYDDLDDSGLLGIFEANGNSVCYYKKNQKIRTFINAHGGMELDKKGQKKKRWQWYFIQGHVHTPPFHPLCFSLNKYISVRVLDQHNIALTFSSNKRSVRFNVGAHLKTTSSRLRGKFAGDESERFLIEKKKEISNVLKNLHGALRLPKSAREGPFPTPAQRKKEKLKSLAGGRDPLPPLEDRPSVIIS